MIITIDTGGTKTLVSSFTDGRISHHKYRFPTPKNPSEYIKKLSSLLQEKYDLANAEVISLGIPGIIKNQIAIFCPNLLWRNFDIPKALKQSLGFTKPIIIENDANLAGLAEIQSLKPVPEAALYITISTGIGTGIIRKGEIDPSFRLSEGGHMLLEFDGILHTWESFASGQAIYETYGYYARDIRDIDTWESIADKISRGLFTIIPLLHPSVIIFGGSIGAQFAQFAKPLEGLLEERLPDYIDRPHLKSSKHPEEAVIYGCYFYAKEALT